jgi:hypothetical protein
MFDDWKDAWRQAVENFQREAAGGAALHARAMERELTTAAGALGKLDDEIRRVQHELTNEREAETVCRRREGLARDVQDDVTMQIAAEYAARHAARIAVLERKSAVLADERELLAADLEAMRKILRDAPPMSSVGSAPSGQEPAAKSSAEKEDDHAFSRLERDARERAVDERLEELKRRMNS